MRPPCNRPHRPPAPPPRSKARAGLLLALPLASLLLGCATKKEAAQPVLDPQLLLAATSSVPGRIPGPKPALVPQAFLPLPPAEPPATQAWMTEQLQQLDNHYASQAAETRTVLQQLTAALTGLPGPQDLAALRGALGRIEGALNAQAGRLLAIEKGLAELAPKPPPGPAAPASPAPPGAPSSSRGRDPDILALTEALKGLQGSPPLTFALQDWIEGHPKHPKTPEALLQLALSFLDNGQPVIGDQVLQGLIAEYPASVQAAEARALQARRPPAKPAPASAHRKAATPGEPPRKDKIQETDVTPPPGRTPSATPQKAPARPAPGSALGTTAPASPTPGAPAKPPGQQAPPVPAVPPADAGVTRPSVPASPPTGSVRPSTPASPTPPAPGGAAPQPEQPGLIPRPTSGLAPGPAGDLRTPEISARYLSQTILSSVVGPLATAGGGHE